MSSVYRRIWDALCAPGRKSAIEATAVTQLPRSRQPAINSNISELETCEKRRTVDDSKEGDKTASFSDLRQITSLKDRWSSQASRVFDGVTRLAGTKYTFFLMCATLLVWAIVGIVTGATSTWQIAIQDAGSIQCYISDTLLMRQQQNNSRSLLKLVCQLRSRNMACKRLLERARQERIIGPGIISTVQIGLEQDLIDTVHLPVENWYDRTCNFVVLVIGSLYSFIFYWAGIVVWIALGPKLKWGNLWQLYVNTATAVELTFTTVFLQNTRHRHMQYLERCLQSIIKADAQMELRLRELMDDYNPNPTAVISPAAVTRGNRAIDYYARIMGSGAGVAISMIIFVVWVSTGPMMQWNSNWWLIIGTYTGLVGFVDGYVLRNDYFRENAFADLQLQTLADEDSVLYELLGISVLLPPETTIAAFKKSVQYRISHAVGVSLSLPHTVLSALIMIVALIAVASAMQWSETGQLICNTPTMIIEGFFLLVLIQAHNFVRENRRVQFKGILVRRLVIIAHIERFAPRPTSALRAPSMADSKEMILLQETSPLHTDGAESDMS